MEELMGAYGGDEEEEEEKKFCLKRAMRSNAVGSYVSKRFKFAQPVGNLSSSTETSVLSVEAPPEVQRELDYPKKLDHSGIPRALGWSLKGHTSGVNVVTHGSLLASAGMDQLSCVWNVWDEKREPARKFGFHRAAVKDVQWSAQGDSLLTCGYDKASRLVDVETGKEQQKFVTEHFVNVVQFHPVQNHSFLSGDVRGLVRLWDVRTGRSVKEYFKGTGQILDMDISTDGRHFVCTTDVPQRNSSDRSIIVWDLEKQIAVSNQVYLEAFTCPGVRYHPHEQSFIVQSHAGYIAIFSARPPFTMNKHKKMEGHEVSGFPIKCNFSPQGDVVVTGSADGKIFFYSYRSCRVLRKMTGHRRACTSVVYHPLLDGIVASGGWDGAVSILK